MEGSNVSGVMNGSTFRLLQPAPRVRELTGAMNLLQHYGLKKKYEDLCQRPLKSSLSDSSYMAHTAGSTEIRRGDGMELTQLLNGPTSWGGSEPVKIAPFDLEVLQRAFSFADNEPARIPENEMGQPTAFPAQEGKADTGKKHKSQKDGDKEISKEKSRRKDGDGKREKHRDRHKEKGDNGDDSHRRNKKKKRKREEGEKDASDKKHKKKHKQESKSAKVANGN